ncbi:hypothetical protein [Nostoc commune]|nr:hypothetical protein [Nostoc commune]
MLALESKRPDLPMGGNANGNDFSGSGTGDYLTFHLIWKSRRRT